MNHRTTLRNFMLSTYRSQNANAKNQEKSQKDIFLSTSRFLLAKQDSKIINETEKIIESSSRLSDNNKRATIRSLDKIEKPIEL